MAIQMVLVEFVEYVSQRDLRRGRFERYHINPLQIGAVIPKKRHTILVVQGRHFFVVGTYTQVVGRIQDAIAQLGGAQ